MSLLEQLSCDTSLHAQRLHVTITEKVWKNNIWVVFINEPAARGVDNQVYVDAEL